ncbi:MAG: TraR/DksA C4-type zinc finger protein [Planctomycetes bacterium]|nr:TraR/DksA C4-type zinc finger protein [Planctomycetota bacterium]
MKEREEAKTAKKKETAAAKKGAKAASPPKNRSASREQLDSIRQALLKKKESLTRYLQSELSELESVDKHHLADLEELASDINDTDSLCEIMDVGNNTLVQIDHALMKIEDGTYGLCEECHGEIPFDRLEALPFATLCIACKRKQEFIRG